MNGCHACVRQVYVSQKNGGGFIKITSTFDPGGLVLDTGSAEKIDTQSVAFVDLVVGHPDSTVRATPPRPRTLHAC